VTGDGQLTLRWNGSVVARLPADFVVKAPLIPWPSREPPVRRKTKALPTTDVGRSLISLLASPNIASKRWVYQQYDHEVGIRTVMKPGQHDAAVLRLPNGAMLAVKGDGNSAHCALDPYEGAAGCVAEACRNVVATGAEPIAMVDHLQFGDPSDPDVYWSFTRSVHGMADYCSAIKLPVVGGKVSFYNEDSTLKKAIKPSPIALVIGLIEARSRIAPMGFVSEGDAIIVVGKTRTEMGGSEYARLLNALDTGSAPRTDAKSDSVLYRAILSLIRTGSVNSVHDCSRGGLAVALAEMCIAGEQGAKVDLGRAPSECRRTDELAFSESHGRFVVATSKPEKVKRVLRYAGAPHAEVGLVGGDSLSLHAGKKKITELDLIALRQSFEECLPRLMD
jgi:phosphoribosylformylglycinamidine synthase subunit PurL